MKFLRTVRKWLGIGQPATDAAPSPVRKTRPFPPKLAASVRASEAHRAKIAAARDLPDGTPADAALIAAIYAEIEARRATLAMSDGPASPKFSGLCVRKTNLPDWWESSGSLMLQSPDTAEIGIAQGFMGAPVQNALIVAGAKTVPPRFNILGEEPFAVLGDGITFLESAMTIGSGAMVLIGENSTATWMSFVDVRNGGALIIGADSMLASGINFMSDDTHAIRDFETGRRLNLRGGRIMLEEHVWLGDHVRIMGDTRIGAHGIIGATSFVKNVSLPSYTVSIGRPARPTRSGVTWTRFDLP